MSILATYREKQADFNSRIAKHTMQTKENLALQELNYRICVLETFQAFSKSAPMGMKVDDLSYHYQLVDAYIKSVLSERQFGAKTDADGKKRRETAHQSLEKVVQAGRKQFSSFAPSKPEQYSQTVGKYINALLPVWMQYRDTYINLQEVFQNG
ncbi:MAG: hypothetical protein HFE92_03515 [Acutalibacter muris]|nr:hypothetical protein [Acutalibacter muris]